MARPDTPGGEEPTPPPSGALRALVRASPRAAPRRPLRELALCVAACALAPASCLAVGGERADLPRLAPLAHWGVAAGWLAAFVLSFAAATVPPRGSALPGRERALCAALSVPSAALTFGVIFRSEAAPPAGILRGGSALQGVTGCIGRGLIVVAVALGVGALALRRHPSGPGDRWPGAAVGAGGGALAGLLLHLQCDVGGALHVAAGHASLTALAALLGAALLPGDTWSAGEAP